ncbi:MAG: MarR family winged helix-turn-helix transcriptional regulator [Planctomycetota bacterium]
MQTLDARAVDFGEIVRDILKQFHHLHDAAAGGRGNLGLQDMKVLECLGERGPQMMGALAEHLGLAVNSMTSVIDHMEQRALVFRTRSDKDRRVVNVDLTESGRAIYESLLQGRMQFHRALLSALTEDEQEILLVLFRKIAREGWKQVHSLSDHEVA